MPIVVNLDVMLARRKVRSKDLAAHVGITEQNLSLWKDMQDGFFRVTTGRAKADRKDD